MLLLLLDAFLLFFISFSVGKLTKQGLSRLFTTQLSIMFLEEFILGLMTTGVYFNLISLFLPVNYLALLPLLVVALIYYVRNSSNWINDYRYKFISLFNNAFNRWIAFFVLGLVLLYYFLPPINQDSADYHYQTVYWYENFKVIPGLGNVHGRLAFNPITFILSAPYSFTTLVGESLYPLNYVLITLFYIWLLKIILQNKNRFSSLVYVVIAILLYRPLLANAPSPSTEPLVIITSMVVFLRLIEMIEDSSFRNTSGVVSLILISFFSVMAKLSSLPLLVVPFVWVVFVMNKQKFGFYVRLSLLVAIIMIPWLIRNVILSGYLLYPLYQLDLFHFDWKVPKDVVVPDYAFGTIGSKGDISEGLLLQKEYQWFLPWIKDHFRPTKVIDLAVFILCFSSPFVWMYLFIKKQQQKFLFILWITAFIGALVWLFRAPEYRFGMSFLLASFCIPMINLTQAKVLKPKYFYTSAYVLFAFASLYYVVRGTVLHPRPNTKGIEMVWLKPLIDKRYIMAKDSSQIRSEYMGNGVRLYFKDRKNDCIRIKGQPCMLWYYGKIEMRGKTITDGFRNVTVEVRNTFPWMFTREW